MLKIHVDFNSMEKPDVIIISHASSQNANDIEAKFVEGLKVILKDETMQCQAVLRKGEHYPWVAEIDRSTIIDLA